MEMKQEVEFKVELVEDIEDNTSNVYSEQLSILEEIQETIPFEYIDVKSEIESLPPPQYQNSPFLTSSSISEGSSFSFLLLLLNVNKALFSLQFHF
ncbi:hypothetical protein Avbf_08905 [Armadillidium vulgare]|nr:hypothetical protein Avbf_08905 [Armadillidium vulgare]